MIQDSYSVSELNTFIRDVLNAGFPQPVWVCGEVQGFDRQKTKRHIFFKLIEKSKSSQQTKAEAELVIWEGVKTYIKKTLQSAPNSFELKDDIEVRFLCKVDFYPPHGRVRLTVEAIDPTYTLGKLAQKSLKVIEKLTKAGLLEKNKQHELPLVPLSIGLITSFDSAAYNDFLAEMKHSGLSFKIFVKNSLMQGKSAPPSILSAIRQFEEMSDIDIIVITRGGGSMTDLSCFDQENIATAVANCQLPVITGIGHEIDLTISDMTAHTTKKTPTATAQFIIERVQNYLDNLDEYGNSILEQADKIITNERNRLKNLVMGLQPLLSEFLRSHHEKIIRYQEILRHKPGQFIKDEKNKLGAVFSGLVKLSHNRIEKEKFRLDGNAKVINISSPVNTLKRGFSITRTLRGKVMRSVGDFKDSDVFMTELQDGTVESTVNIQSIKERK